MTDDRDPVLDSLLEEAVGVCRPPDLTERILTTLNARGAGNSAAASNGDNYGAQQDCFEDDGLDPKGSFIQVGQRQRPVGRRLWSGQVITLAALAGSVAVLLIAGVVFIPRSDRVPGRAEPREGAGASVATIDVVPTPTDAPVEVAPVQITQAAPATIAANREGDRVARSTPAAPPAPVATTSSVPAPATSLTTTTPAPSLAVMKSPSSDAEIVEFVNSELASLWTEAGVKPSPPASDEEWCRRLFMQVLGRAPKVREELNAFLADNSRDKRQRLVTRLLNDEDYAVEYARHWSLVWSHILVGRMGGRGNSLANRAGLEQYLRSALRRNKPYNVIVSELLTAAGAARPAQSDYNPAVNFLLDGLDKDGVVPTARVARVFLGQRLQCAQCHDHPSQEWSQEQFWALNSFFRQLKAEKHEEFVRLVNVDYRASGNSAAAGMVFYETPMGLLKSATPRFLDGTEIPESGELAVVDRRRELARLVATSDLANQALVNRLWAQVFGFGFTRPVDDMGVNPSPEAGAVLDRLAQEFAAHKYDLKSAIRWMVLSDPFARSSKLADLATKDMPESGETALFSRFYSRPPQGGEVFATLVQVAQIRKSAGNESEVEKARISWLAQFNRGVTAEEPKVEAKKKGAAPPPVIATNGDLTRRALSSQDAALVKRISASAMKFDQKVEHVFLAAVGREPVRREQNAAARVLANSKGDQAIALEDIWWGLASSNESILGQ